MSKSPEGLIGNQRVSDVVDPEDVVSADLANRVRNRYLVVLRAHGINVSPRAISDLRVYGPDDAPDPVIDEETRRQRAEERMKVINRAFERC